MSERTQLIPGYHLTVLSGALEHLCQPFAETSGLWDFRKTDTVTRFNTSEPDFYRVGDVIFMVQARQAEPLP